MSLQKGIRNVSASDVEYAETLGFVIKLLAIAKRNPQKSDQSDTIQLRVHPTLVPVQHPLASVNDVNNAVLVEGDPIGQVMLYGPGAGEGPTASAIVSDVMAIAATLHMESPAVEKLPNPLLSNAYSDYKTISPMEELKSRFYLRLMVKDQPGVIGHLGEIFGNHDLSLESIVQIGLQDNLAELVIVTHEVQEGAFQHAMVALKESDDVDSIASILRVLG